MDITYALLKKKGACSSQLALFHKAFRDNPAPLGDATGIKYAGVFDFGWAATHLFPTPVLKSYQDAEKSLQAEYEAARAPLLKAYRTAERSLYDAYGASKLPWESYLAIKDSLWEDYEAAKDPLLEQYHTALALTFVRLARGAA